MAQGTDMELAFTGNCYLQNKISVFKDEGFLKVVELLRNSDCAFTNFECVVHDGEDFPAYVAGNGRGATYMAASPVMIDELQWAGIRMVYAANNHCADFAEGGIMTTIKYMKQKGLAYAGIGPSLTGATAPGYIETSKGRVALISVSDWGPRGIDDLPYQMPSAVMPGDGGAFFKNRPGVNLLRYDAVPMVDKATLDALRRASKMLDWERAKASRRSGGGRAEGYVGDKLLGGEMDTDTEFHFMGRKFQLSDKWDFRTEPYQSDLDRNYRAIREARGQADIVICALHDQGARRVEDEEHTKIFARGSIDAGADIYLNHGARHGGVEIYKGKVILYGQPGFYLQNEQVQQVPYEMMTRWGLSYEHGAADFIKAREGGERQAGGASVGAGMRGGGFRGSAIHVVVFDKDKKAKEVRIYPIEPLAEPKIHRGRPFLAKPGSDAANGVLKRAQEASAAYGTKVDVVNGVGIVKVQ